MPTRVEHINKDLERIIITCFGPNGDAELSAGQIKDCVKKYIKESNQNIQKKIERMSRKEHLMHITLANGDYIYYLNKEIHFELIGPAIKPLRD